MKKHITLTALLLILPLGFVLADSGVVSQLLQHYADNGAEQASAERGKKLWITVFDSDGEFGKRSCSSCHGEDLAANGKHVKTGKTIQAMSPSINPDRLADAKKVEKWFKRNCKWTLGRECTAQEKSDFLLFLSNPVTF